MALISLSWSGPLALDEVVAGEAVDVFSTWHQQAEEETAEVLTRAFIAAYSEEDKDEPSLLNNGKDTNGSRIIIT
jgi:hypothetical protein